LPVFDQRQSQLLAADSELRSAQRRLEALVLVVRTDLRTHGAEVAATRALNEQYRDQVLPNLRQIQAQLDGAADQGTSVDRMHQRLSALASEEEAVGFLRDYWRARSALARAAGDWGGLGGDAATMAASP